MHFILHYQGGCAKICIVNTERKGHCMVTRRARIGIFKLVPNIFVFLIAHHAAAFECFSDAPSVEAGRGIYDEAIPRELVDNEYQELDELLQSLDGRWAGTAEIVVCFGRDDEAYTETDEYRIKTKVNMKRSGDFVLYSTLTSRDKRTKRDEIIRLCLSRDRLATVCNKAKSDIELIAVSSQELVYLQKTPKKISRDVKLMRETVTAFQKTADASLTVEKLDYSQGKLKSITTWYLEKE